MIILFFFSISGSRYFLTNEDYSVIKRFSPLITETGSFIQIKGYGSITEKGGAALSLYSKHFYFSVTGNYLGTDVEYSEKGDSLGNITFGSVFSEVGYISYYNNLLFSIIVKPFYEFMGRYNAFGFSSTMGIVSNYGIFYTGIMLKELGIGAKYETETGKLPLRIEALSLLKFKTIHPNLSIDYFINDEYISIGPGIDFHIDFFTVGILYKQNLWS